MTVITQERLTFFKLMCRPDYFAKVYCISKNCMLYVYVQKQIFQLVEQWVYVGETVFNFTLDYWFETSIYV